LKTQEAVTKLGWTVLSRPPYSPDLAPSDFHLFGALKDAIRGKRFGSDDEVIEEVKKWPVSRGFSFHLGRLKKTGIAATIADVRTRCLPNTSLNNYRHTSRLGIAGKETSILITWSVYFTDVTDF
jgi:hypothetical protein